MITGHTQLFGLIGNPVEHTFSPFIHNMLAEETGIDMIYTAFKVDQGGLDDAIKGLKALNIQGANVTVPYKMDVMSYMDEVDKAAQNIGAMNTVVRRDNLLKGYNTDAFGLLRSMELEGVKIEGQDILIVGAGGAARAIAVMCAQEKARTISFLNRTKEKAQSLATLINAQYATETFVLTREALEKRLSDIGVGICFQTTSVGMSPEISSNPLEGSFLFEKLNVAVDIIYNPEETQFLRCAREAGAVTINGMGMLYYQAVLAFELWHDMQIDASIVKKCYKAFLDKMSNK